MSDSNRSSISAAVNRLLSLEPVLDQFVVEQTDHWTDFRRTCHSLPEISGQETQTSRRLLDELTKLGLSAHIPDRGVGVVADLLLGNATDQTPAIVIRADIDALPMPDDKTVAYASKNDGVAHTCGHDVHQTIGLAVAKCLVHLQNAGVQLPAARIRFLMQAAEETCQGAQWMVQDGYVDNVHTALAVHVEPNLLAGEIGIRHGALTAQVDEIQLTISGASGHTARPHISTDTIHAAAILVSQLYQLLPRSIDVRDPSVLSFGSIQGGETANVIPAEVRLRGTLRTISTEARQQLITKMRQICDAMATVTGNQIHLEFLNPLGSVRNAPVPTQAFEAAARRTVGDSNVRLIEVPSMGGEDFAMYCDHCQVSQIRLGCASRLPWPHLHSTVFDIDESAIAIGVRTLVRTTLILGMVYDEN